MRIRILMSFVVAGLLLAACTSNTADSSTTSTSVAEAAVSTTAEATSTTAITTTTEAATTTTATAETSTTTEAPTTTETTTTAPPPTLEVNNQGVQAGDEWVYFGYDDEDAIEAVSTVFGPPEDDSGWIDSFSVYGTCPGPVVRGVHWGGFTMLFTQADTDFWTAGVPHFFAYYYTSSPPGIRTSEGLTLGMTLADLESLYGGADLVTGEADLVPGATFWSYKKAMWTGMWGYADGLVDASQITSINGGLGCGE